MLSCWLGGGCFKRVERTDQRGHWPNLQHLLLPWVQMMIALRIGPSFFSQEFAEWQQILVNKRGTKQEQQKKKKKKQEVQV